MPRGIIPRQPAKTGRQDRAARGVPQTSRLRSSGKPPVKPAAKAKPAAKTGKRVPQTSRFCSSGSTAPERIRELLKRLDTTYPGVTCALTHQSAWELLVATILSAQCTDERVNKVTPGLFHKYPGPQDFARLAPEQLEPEIRSTGFFRNKSKSIVGAAKKVVSDFGGEVPADMDQLLTLPGVARKTANVVLGTWFGKAEGVVVDTHVQRIARRLELTANTDANKIEQDLMRVIPREKWTSFAHQLIWHGRRLCTARSPRCVDCPLETICHAADKTWSTVEMHKSAKP